MTTSISTMNSQAETTEETLNRMHNAKLAQCSGTEELMDYLLSSATFLRSQNLSGWREAFEVKPPPPPQKRLRQSPNLMPVTPLPLCTSCGSDQVIDDVPQGQYVCIMCGLIQQQGVFSGDPAHCSMDRLFNTARVHIHHYSRIVHFRTTIRLMQADSHPMIEADVLSCLRLALNGKSRPSVEDVMLVLRKEGLARKLRRHKFTLTVLLGGEQPKMIDAGIVFTMLKLFRRLEYFWNYHHEQVAPGRKVFLSYPFIFYQLAHQLGHPELTGDHHLLKNKKLSRFQFDSYERLCHFTGFPFTVQVPQ